MKKVFLAALAVLLCGCKAPAPTYHYDQVSPDDPEIDFQSNFELHSWFDVNTKNPLANRCEDFDYAGLVLKKDSVFLYDKPNPELKIHVPADRPLAVSARQSSNLGDYASSCGPLEVGFTPKGGHRYIVNLAVDDPARPALCYITVSEFDAHGTYRKVDAAHLPKCSRH